MYKNLERVLCKELEKLDEAYEGKNEMSEADAKKLDMIAHAWKSLLTGTAMHEANENEGLSYGNGMSATRRNMRNGRYMSSEAWDGRSGHYPPPWYPPRSYGNGPDDWNY